MKLKSLGYSEEDILDDIHTANGDPVPSVKALCETRAHLQHAAKVLGFGDCETTTPTADAGVMQAGRRTDGGQGGVQSTACGNQSCMAETVTPQQQQLPHGSVAQTFTPHQFGLTQFPSTSSIYL